jgi:hypothetical protein
MSVATWSIYRRQRERHSAWGAALGQPAFVTSTFEELTATPARTFLPWATDNAASFRA